MDDVFADRAREVKISKKARNIGRSIAEKANFDKEYQTVLFIVHKGQYAEINKKNIPLFMDM